MAVARAISPGDYWVERLHMPAYRVAEAARYARTTSQTVRNWQKIGERRQRVIAPRERGAALSYLQLIELGVVAAMRKSGIKLPKIRNAREYLSKKINSDYPFAQYQFKTDGVEILMDLKQIEGEKGVDKLIVLSGGGQLAWNEILHGLLLEFDYDLDIGAAVSWKVAGLDSPVRIDPRLAFGAPQVEGVPTWVLRARWESGESLGDIADDYGLAENLVDAALRFEGVEVDPERPDQWVH